MFTRKLNKSVKLLVFLLLAGWLPGALWAASAAAYRRIANEIALLANRSSIERITVLPFETSNPSDKTGSMMVSERVLSNLAGHKKIKLVERRHLKKVLNEQRLQNSGVVNSRQAKEMGRVMGVDAIVTGTILDTGGRTVEVNARLIDAQDARVIGVATEKVARDWEAAQPEEGMNDGEFIISPPALSMNFAAWWESGLSAGGFGEKSGCENWEKKIDRLQEEQIDVKAYFWADELRRPGFSPKTLTKNPGSEIRSLQLRSEFHRRLKRIHASGIRQRPSALEMRGAAEADSSAKQIADRCDR